ncbi:SRPBCC family protein [Inquilinus limosus]|uniref:SRPBCC family protein n=1 Tax=Inquilinus limosus TaxID=171674 RepID=UPI003F17823C
MTSSILVSLRVATTPERAFTAFVQDIGLWWRPNPLFQFTPGEPGGLHFEPGLGGRFVETHPDGHVFEIGRISVWEPGSRLVFSWRQASFSPGQSTEVDVRFEPVGDQTRVTVEHRGWDSVPQDHVARHHFPDAVFLQRHGEWWQALLGAYRASARFEA